MIDPHAYTITVRRRNVEGEMLFEASVAELPDLSGYGETYQEAYEFVVDLIDELGTDAEREGRSFPKPRTEAQGDYSGRLTLRLTRKIHRMAAEAAQMEGVSLNSYLSMAIAQHVAEENIQYDFYSAVRDVVATIAAQRSPAGTESLGGYLVSKKSYAGAAGAFLFDKLAHDPTTENPNLYSGFETWRSGVGKLAVLQFIPEK